MAEPADADTVRAIALEVAKILGRPSEDPLMTAQQVAAMLGVSPWWVYDHARELGVIRMGDGPRPRVRFDPAIIAQRLLPPAPPPQLPTEKGGANSPRPDLLPIKGPSRPRPQ